MNQVVVTREFEFEQNPVHGDFEGRNNLEITGRITNLKELELNSGVSVTIINKIGIDLLFANYSNGVITLTQVHKTENWNEQGLVKVKIHATNRPDIADAILKFVFIDSSEN